MMYVCILNDTISLDALFVILGCFFFAADEGR